MDSEEIYSVAICDGSYQYIDWTKPGHNGNLAWWNPGFQGNMMQNLGYRFMFVRKHGKIACNISVAIFCNTATKHIHKYF